MTKGCLLSRHNITWGGHNIGMGGCNVTHSFEDHRFVTFSMQIKCLHIYDTSNQRALNC